MKSHIKSYAYLILFLASLISISSATEVSDKPRRWTLKNGKSATAKLVQIQDNTITLLAGKKRIPVKLNDLSPADRAYIRSFIKTLPSGSITDYVPQFKNDKDKKTFKKYDLKSYAWKDGDKKLLPFVVYEPKKFKAQKKLPVIIFLHGTGALGADNTRPFCAGAVEHLVTEKFQATTPCYIVVPQTKNHSGWYSAHYTDPSDELTWLKNTLLLMGKDKRFAIDMEKLYIMGLSMGGHGVYEALAKFPNFYAAGVPIAAVDEGASFHKKNCKTFMWIALNSGDKSEPVSTMKSFAKMYRRNGGHLKTTIYNTSGHNAWDKMLKDKKFVRMLFQQRRK